MAKFIEIEELVMGNMTSMIWINIDKIEWFMPASNKAKYNTLIKVADRGHVEAMDEIEDVIASLSGAAT
jgi:uncharacterized protein YfbU (UPF0304 family)